MRGLTDEQLHELYAKLIKEIPILNYSGSLSLVLHRARIITEMACPSSAPVARELTKPNCVGRRTWNAAGRRMNFCWLASGAGREW